MSSWDASSKLFLHDNKKVAATWLESKFTTRSLSLDCYSVSEHRREANVHRKAKQD